MIDRIQKTVKVRVPASAANLGPGFDVLGAAVRLYNEIEVTVDERPRKNGPVIEIEGEGDDVLPRNRKNVVWQAMQEVFDRTRTKRSTVAAVSRLRLVNAIPLSSGLGSSAAARLGGILAANEIAGRPLSHQEMLSLGVRLEGHPDNIVPALCGGLCVAAFDGRKVNYVKLPAPGLAAVVCTPDFGLSTEHSRRVLPRHFPMATVVFNSARLALLLAAFQSRNYELLGMGMEDRLHQPSREHLIPGMSAVFAAARNTGACGAALSGAGPSIVALCPERKAASVAGAMRKKWRQFNITSRSFVLGFDTVGARVLCNDHGRERSCR